MKDTKLKDGAYILYHRKEDNEPVAAQYSLWPTLQDKGEIADGVLVVCEGRNLVIAPEEKCLNWSNKRGVATEEVEATYYAINDWEGKNKTAKIIAHPSFKKDGKQCAPGYCYAYSRTNDNGVGITAGQWWLPSAAELVMMWRNFKIINDGLKLITGATLLMRTWYWSSTEYSASRAWFLYFSNGFLYPWYGKVSGQGQVRAVSGIIGESFNSLTLQLDTEQKNE